MDRTVIGVDGGFIEGEILINKLNDEPFYSFKGVPYARPPIGSLRFKPPESVEKWDGVRQCKKHGNACCQKMLFTGPLLPIISGAEDCLYLNIYSPVGISCESLRPVMVFIHGGGFQSGSSNSNLYGPDFLIAKDVVLVTINYRLNIFGLFHKAIKASACVLDPWAYMDPEVSIRRAFRVGEKLGCVTHDVKELHEFLMAVPAKKLVRAVLSIMTTEDLHTGLAFSFVPSKEICGSYKGRFLPSEPRTLLTQAPTVPVLLGLNSSEGFIIYLENHKMLNKVKKDPGRAMDTMFPDDLKSISNDRSKVAVAKNEVRQFYLEAQKNIPVQKFADFFGDINFLRGNYQWLKTCLSYSDSKPIFLYLFDFDTAISIIKLMPGLRMPDYITGSCHGDDLLFLFSKRILDYCILRSDACKQVVENLTTVWTNFAKFGDPKGSIEIDWKPLTLCQPVHCKIGQKLEIQDGFIYEDRIKFWSDLELSMLSQCKL